MVLGITGGIAAYKAIEVCRRLVDAGAHVVPVMTTGATRFVGETTLSALASEPVQRSLWSEASPIPHTRLGQSADVVVVAPATARLLADYASGRSADLLTATLLATRAPVIVCPAMHTEMWEHPAVQENLSTLRARGVVVVDPEPGRLAGGDIGHGRLADPARITAAVEAALSSPDLAGLHVLVTAGGTREPIDPVRYLGNRSSGKQGHALAAEARRRGATVTLVTTAVTGAPPGMTTIEVETADEMHRTVCAVAPQADIVVMAAAVADFRPATIAPGKLKKQAGPPEIVLEPTVDILAELGSSRAARPDPRRVRGGDHRRGRERPGQAARQGRRSRGGQRRIGPRHRFCPRHQRGVHLLCGRLSGRGGAQLEGRGGPSGVRRCRGPPPRVSRSRSRAGVTSERPPAEFEPTRSHL